MGNTEGNFDLPNRTSPLFSYGYKLDALDAASTIYPLYSICYVVFFNFMTPNNSARNLSAVRSYRGFRGKGGVNDLIREIR